MKNIFKNLLLFFLTFIIIIVCFIFSNNVQLVPDVQAQYIPIINFFKNIIISKDTFFYSFNNGLGGGIFSLFFYYFASPINLIFLFLKVSTTSILLVSSIKIGVSAVTMHIFLMHKGENKYNFILSLCYALMGYNIVYIYNYFWLDIIYMLPIVLIGVDYIILRKSPKLFIISMGISLFLNFYISFSLYIFCVFYLLFELFYFKIKHKKEIIYKFVFLSFIVFLLCAWFLIPIFFDIIGNINRNNYFRIFNFDWSSFFSIIYNYMFSSSNLSRHGVIFDDQPILYTSIFVFIINFLILFSKKIKQEKKLIIIIFSLLFSLSTIFTPLYDLWHGFSKTIGFPYRFCYLWSFFNVYIAKIYLDNYVDAKNTLKNNLKYIIIFASIYLILLFIFCRYIFYNNGFELISILFLILYSFLFIKNKIKILCILIIFELFLNVSLSVYWLKKNYVNENNCIVSNNEYFRINTPTFTDTFLCNYSTPSDYSSTINSRKVSFLQKAGVNAFSNKIYYYRHNTPLLDSLLSVAYEIDENANITKNNNVLSIGYMINKNKILESKNPIEFQQDILNSMINEDIKYFKKYKLNKLDIYKYSFINNGKDKFMLLTKSDFSVNVKIDYLLNGIAKENINENIFTSVIFKIDDDNKDNITIKIENLNNCKSCNVYLYDFNYENLNYAINKLSKHQLNITKKKENVLEGNVDVADNKILFISIPYEEGWNIYVDGEKTDYFKLYDTFIGINLTEGHHEIKMKFYPKGLKAGIIVSVSSLISILIYRLFKYKRKKVI